MFDTGCRVKCNNCGQVFFMWNEVHQMKDRDGEKVWNHLGGRCPSCFAYVTGKVKKNNVVYFPPHESYPSGEMITPCPYYDGGEDDDV